MPKDQATHPIDIMVGKNLRRLRVAAGISQGQLGAKLSYPISFQQVQKYELGLNRIAASRLAEIATILSCPIEALFDGIDNFINGKIDPVKGIDPDHDSKLNNLCRNYGKLPSELQDALRQMTAAMAHNTIEE